jgi:hypothetical protein
MHRTRLLLGAAALVAVTALATNTLVAAPQDPADPGGAGMEMDPAMMAEMMRLAMPGEEHAELMKGAGEWDNHFRMRMAPDAPWMEFTGSMTARPMLEGRYLLEEQQFDYMGMPMKGVNILGYDNSTGEYTSMWADTMSTWWISTRGKKDADGAIDFRGTMKDVVGERPFRMVIQFESDDEVLVRMYDTIPPQGEVEVMQITSKRRK